MRQREERGGATRAPLCPCLPAPAAPAAGGQGQASQGHVEWERQEGAVHAESRLQSQRLEVESGREGE